MSLVQGNLITKSLFNSSKVNGLQSSTKFNDKLCNTTVIQVSYLSYKVNSI